MRQIHLIGVEMGVGSPKPGTAKGPTQLKETALADQLQAPWKAFIQPEEDDSIAGTLEALPRIVRTCTELASATARSISQDGFPCIIGGDHAIAVGTWSGIVSQLKSHQKFGLIWIDAHMDSHTDKTTPSNAIHGMPLAALMGHGFDDLTAMASSGAKLSPEHVVLIGVRSFEEGEELLLKRLNVRVIDRQEVHERGFDACFQEALNIAQNGTKGFGISVDLDAFDPEFAPGVGVPEVDGLSPDEVLPALKGVIQNLNLKAFEVVELNPPLDKADKTLKLAQDLMTTALKQDS